MVLKDNGALDSYLSVINNILSEHGRARLHCEDEIALVRNMFQSNKSYVDCVVTVLMLRKDWGQLG